MEDLEQRLYATLHHDLTENTDPIQQNKEFDEPTNKKSLHANGRTTMRKSNSRRYWNTNSNTALKNMQFYKDKQSQAPTIEANSEKMLENLASTSSQTNLPPKSFTPYVSLLPDSNLTVTTEKATPEELSTDLPENIQSAEATLKTTNEFIKNKVATKKINPFSKDFTIEQYKNQYEMPAIIDKTKGESFANKKRLNPFNELSRQQQKQNKKKENNKDRNKKNRKRKSNSENNSVIDLDANEDDDVIILPTQAPPLICVDSSDDEILINKYNESIDKHEFTEPTATVSDSRRAKNPRLESPSSSIQSADDFIANQDQYNFGFDTFATLSDEDLCKVGETVENTLRKSVTTTLNNKNDSAIFTPPKQMHKELKSKLPSTSRKSYEVCDSSFVAIDVYESESSDMPDSIYAKGNVNKRKLMSNSDSSSVESINVPKSKKFRKRKSSGKLTYLIFTLIFS